MFSTLIDIINNCILGDDRKGIFFINGKDDEFFLSYNDLNNKALRILGKLQEKGVKRCEEVVLQIEDNETFLSVFWACLLGGLVPVSANVGDNDESKHKVIKLLSFLDNPHIVTGQKNLDTLEAAAHTIGQKDVFDKYRQNAIMTDELKDSGAYGTAADIKPEDTAFIQFSSGSTGDPKGVVLTHGNLISNICAIRDRIGLSCEDITLSWVPLTHDMGMIGCHLFPMLLKMNQCIMPTSLFLRYPVLWISKVNEHKATTLVAPNFGYKLFLSSYNPQELQEWDLSHVKAIFNGAEPVSLDICSKFIDEMARYNMRRDIVFPVYGMAEATLAVTIPPPGEAIPYHNLDRGFLGIGDKVIHTDGENKAVFVEVGLAVNDCEIRICGNENEILEENRIGYIQVRGKSVAKGYYNNKKATAGIFSRDNWLITGDLGFITKGRLVITGRAKDIIFANGQNIYPHDIERIAEQVEGVEPGKVAVCGVYGDKPGESEVVAFVVHEEGLESFVPVAAKLKKHILKNAGLTIKHAIPVSGLQKTASGKLQRYAMGDRYLAGEFSELISSMEKLAANNTDLECAAANDIEKSLLKVFREFDKLKSISPDDDLLESGGDSILLAQLQSKVEELYPAKVKISDLFTYNSIRKLSEFIMDTQNITFPAIALPEEYFTSEGQGHENACLNFKLETKLSDLIKHMADMESVSVGDVLLGLYIYLYSRITGKNELSIAIPGKENKYVGLVNFNISGICDLNSLFKLVSKSIEDTPQYYNYNEFSLNTHKASNSIRMLFYRKSLLKETSKSQDIFDMAFEYEDDGDIICTIQYNAALLKKEKMKEMLLSYGELMEAAAARY